MKKILAILGTIGMLSTTVGLAVSCGSSSSSTHENLDFSKVDESIFNGVYSDLSKNGFFDGVEYPKEQIYKKFKDEFSTIVQKIINEKLYNVYEGKISNNIAKAILKATKTSEVNSEAFQNQLSQLVSNKLYKEVTSAIASDETGSALTTFEKKIVDSNGWLDPIVHDETNNVDTKFITEVSNDHGTTWSVWDTLSAGPNIFTNGVESFQNATYRFVQSDNVNIGLDKDGKVATGTDIYSFNSGDTFNTSELNSVLLLKYQYYANYTLTTDDIYNSAFTATYLNENIFNIRNDSASAYGKGLFLNRLSPVSSFVQSWGRYQEDFSNYQSNLKMIWSFEFENKDNTNVKDVVDSFMSANKPDRGMNGEIKAGASIIDLVHELNTYSTPITNTSSNGSDPWFSLSGYQGIAKIGTDGSFTTVDGTIDASLSSNTSSKNLIVNSRNEAVITNDGAGFNINETKPGFSTIYLSMPIYSVDIFGNLDTKISTANPDTVSISNTGYTALKSVVDGDTSTISDPAIVHINDADFIDPTQIGETGLTINGITIKTSDKLYTIKTTRDDKVYNNEVRLSPYQKNAAGYASDMNQWIDGVIVNGNNLGPHYSNSIINLASEQKESLLNKIKALTIANDSKLIEAAKTSIYSQYLSKDDIFWKTLLNDLSNFILDNYTFDGD